MKGFATAAIMQRLATGIKEATRFISIAQIFLPLFEPLIFAMRAIAV